MHKKIRKANLGMQFNGSPVLTQLDLNNQFNTVQFGQNPDPFSKTEFKGYKVPKYTLLPDQNQFSLQGPQYNKYLTQQRETLFPNNQQTEKVNNQFNAPLEYTSSYVSKKYQPNLSENPFEKINSPLYIGNLLRSTRRITGNYGLQYYGNELWKREYIFQ